MATLFQLSTPQYADIFQWLQPLSEGAKQSWAKQSQGKNIIGYHTEQVGGGEGGSIDVQVPDYDTEWSIDQTQVPDKYKGLVSAVHQGNLGSNPWVEYDYSKIPGGGKTASGKTIDQMYSLGTGAEPQTYFGAPTGGRKQDAVYVKDPNKISYDPQFGWLTDQMNMIHPEEDSKGAFGFMDKYGMPAAMAAMSFFGGPQMALAMGLFGGAKSAIQGAPLKNIALNLAPSLIGAGLGGLGGAGGWAIPSELQTAFNLAKTGYGAYNAAKSRNPFAAIGPGMTLAQLTGIGG